MEEPSNLLNAWRMAKAMGCRPSAIYQVEERHGSYAAYCFDSAITTWGSAFENALERAGSNAKNTQAAERAQGTVLRRWLGAQATGYRDPAKG